MAMDMAALVLVTPLDQDLVLDLEVDRVQDLVVLEETSEHPARLVLEMETPRPTMAMETMQEQLALVTLQVMEVAVLLDQDLLQDQYLLQDQDLLLEIPRDQTVSEPEVRQVISIIIYLLIFIYLLKYFFRQFRR